MSESKQMSGLVVSQKVNKHFISISIEDADQTVCKACYHISSQKEVQTSFYAPAFEKYGTVETLSKDLIERRHLGKITHLLRLNKNMSVEEVLEKILVPGAIYSGLKPKAFFLKNGESPFDKKGGPFMKGFLFHCFTNKYGEAWAAYINPRSKDIWLSSNDDLIGWEWKLLENIENKDYTPWVMDPAEKGWLALLAKESEELHAIYNTVAG